jgi:ATP-dependent protease ClpP protease subunit
VSVDLNKLGQLANQVREKARPSRATDKSWYRISNTGGNAEVWIYDMIGEWGITASDFVADLKSLGNQPVDIHINSEGGSVFDGVAIYTAIKQHAAHTTGYIDSLAASAASFIAMACDTVVMAKQGRIFIHDAQGLVMGSAKDMRDTAAVLDDLSDNIASIYADRTGGTVKEWRKNMAAEKWYDAEAAVSAGLADSIDAPPTVTPVNGGSTTETTARWNPQQFAEITKGVFG